MFSHEGTAKCCKMTPVVCILCVLILRCQECKRLYARKNHVIIKEELFPFWSPRPSKSITGNRMLQQEAVLTLRLLDSHDGLCLSPDRGGKCRCSSLGNHPGTVICMSTSLGTLCLCPLLPCCCRAGFHRCSSQEKAAAALNPRFPSPRWSGSTHL